MHSAVRRVSTRLLALTTMTAALVATTSVISQETAQARCAGIGHPVLPASQYYPFGVVLVEERADPTTCDNDNAYAGYLVDMVNDGGAVAIHVQDSATSGWRRVKRHEEPAGVEVRFLFHDFNGNRHVNESLCANAQGGAIDYGCGWAGSEGAHGDNWGF
jgi:hypothetical protein